MRRDAQKRGATVSIVWKPVWDSGPCFEAMAAPNVGTGNLPKSGRPRHSGMPSPMDQNGTRKVIRVRPWAFDELGVHVSDQVDGMEALVGRHWINLVQNKIP